MTPEQQTPASVVERLRAPHGSAYRFIAANMIESLSAEREGLEAELVEARTLDKGFYEWMIERDLLARGEEVEWSDIVVALTEHEVECSAFTQGESRQTGEAGWRDIATAPRDGSKVLLADAEATPTVLIALWNGVAWDDGDYLLDGFTHWMPLPAAPTPADGGGE